MTTRISAERIEDIKRWCDSKPIGHSMAIELVTEVEALKAELELKISSNAILIKENQELREERDELDEISNKTFGGVKDNLIAMRKQRDTLRKQLDVAVKYIVEDGKEYPISSQFCLAEITRLANGRGVGG